MFDDFFKVNEIIVSHRRYDGKMSPDQRRLVFERGDAVAALLFNVDTRSVVLVEQFRVPSLIGRRRDDPTTTDGRITEVMAGMINENETAKDAVIREISDVNFTDNFGNEYRVRSQFSYVESKPV